MKQDHPADVHVGQQHPISLYLKVWAYLFVLSTMSYMVDYLRVQGIVRWTLIILFVGVGIYLMGWYGGDENQKQSGWRVMKTGFILFIIFGAFFEMIFSSFSNILFPVLLMLLGAYLVVSRSGLIGAKKTDVPSDNSIPPAS